MGYYNRSSAGPFKLLSLSKLKKAIQILASLGLGVGILFWLFTKENLDWASFQVELKKINWYWIILGIVNLQLSWLYRAIRWQMQIEAIDRRYALRDLWAASITGVAINYLIPRSGELLKCAWVGKKTGSSTPRLIGTVVTERAIDVLCLILIVGIGFFLEYDVLISFLLEEAKVPYWLFYLAVFGSLFGLASLFAIKRLARSQGGIFAKAWDLLMALWEGILSIRKLKRPFLFIALTLLIWSSYVLMQYLVFFAYPPASNFGFEVALIVFIFSSFGIVVPTPGGIGSFQFFAQTALIISGMASASALFFANIMFWPFVISNIVFGTIGFLILSNTPDKSNPIENIEVQ